jgi:hypothetical protein
MAKTMSPWQRLPKARRAAVYRAIGRAAKIVRESGEATTATDLRIAMDVLRTHAMPGRSRTT